MNQRIQLLILPLVTVACVAWLSWFGPTLDSVQAEFESRPDGRGYNWPVFHQSNSIAKLKCRDVSRMLRVCDIAMPTIDPMTGESDGWAHQPFACNLSTCGWLSD